MTKYISKYTALITIINIMLGVGPIIVVSPFLQAGFLLSTVWMFILAFISYIGAINVIQSIISLLVQYRCNQLLYQQSNPKIQFLSEKEQQQNRQEQLQKNRQEYELKKAFEYGEMGKMAYGRGGQILGSVTLIIYLTGVIIMKCILVGNTFSKLFKGVIILNQYYFWMGIFFIAASVFSFKNVQNTKYVQYFIIIFRFLSIAMFIIGSLIIMFKYSIHSLTPSGYKAINFNYFPQLFSSTVFSINFHSTIPSIICLVKPQNGISFFIRLTFLIALIVLISIPVTGILAFGEGVINSQNPSQPKNYNQNFQAHLKPIYYFTSFYVFLNISAVPVLTIITRNNLLRLIDKSIDVYKLSRKTVGATIVLLIIVGLASAFGKNFIQQVIDFTAGISGMMLLLILPCFFLYKLKAKRKSILTHKYTCLGGSILGIILIIYSFVKLIIQKTKK